MTVIYTKKWEQYTTYNFITIPIFQTEWPFMTIANPDIMPYCPMLTHWPKRVYLFPCRHPLRAAGAPALRARVPREDVAHLQDHLPDRLRNAQGRREQPPERYHQILVTGRHVGFPVRVSQVIFLTDSLVKESVFEPNIRVTSSQLELNPTQIKKIWPKLSIIETLVTCQVWENLFVCLEC